jgi:Tol biopolymer transport system component
MLGPGRALFSASSHGVLALHSHRDHARLAWIGRDGREIGAVGNPGDMLRLRLSPDGGRALFDRSQQENGAFDLWLIDLERGLEQRLTSAPTPEGGGTWLPDGRGAFFAAVRGGPPRIFRKDLATGAEQEVFPQRGLQEPEDVSNDGRFFLFSERTKAGEYDLWVLPLTGEPTPRPVLQAPFDQYDARFSNDGRHIAFISTESGQPEVYVTSMPAGRGITRVSPAGGRSPRWSRDGRTLFYISATHELMAAAVSGGATFIRVGEPSRAFPLNPVVRWRTFDVAPDGRFLAIVIDSLAASQPLIVRTNWLSGR